LLETNNNLTNTITSLLRNLSEYSNIPISTLKVNARILRDLGLIAFGNSSQVQRVKITDFGRFILEILEVKE